jgi:hypothetical protein
MRTTIFYSILHRKHEYFCLRLPLVKVHYDAKSIVQTLPAQIQDQYIPPEQIFTYI